MCGRFEVLTYEEVAAVVAAVEGRRTATTCNLNRAHTVANHAAPPTPSEPSAHAAPRQHARPGSSILVFGRSGQAETEDHASNLEIADSIWGFQPAWSAKLVFNTRIESACSGSGMWHKPIQTGRCVIPAAAFYEPHATETVRSPRTGRPIKQQYRFASLDHEPLLLAGVQEAGRCSVVTCAPNRWVSPIHDRMPLVLRFEEVDTWLSPDWPALADRSDMELATMPELPVQSDRLNQSDERRQQGEPDQLSLF